MNEPEDAQVKEAVSRYHSEHELIAPDFDDTWRKANNSLESRSTYSSNVWQIAGIAASIAVVAVLYAGSSNTLFTDVRTQDQAGPGAAKPTECINKQLDIFFADTTIIRGF